MISEIVIENNNLMLIKDNKYIEKRIIDIRDILEKSITDIDSKDIIKNIKMDIKFLEHIYKKHKCLTKETVDFISKYS